MKRILRWIPADCMPGAGLVAVEAVLIGVAHLANSHRHHTLAAAAVLIAMLIGIMAVAMLAGALRRGGRR